MKSDLFLEEARLGPRDSALIEHDEKPHLVGVKRRFHDYVHVDLAHVVMLMESEILDSERGVPLVRSLGDIYDLGPDEFPWDPRSGLFEKEGHLLGFALSRVFQRPDNTR